MDFKIILPMRYKLFMQTILLLLYAALPVVSYAQTDSSATLRFKVEGRVVDRFSGKALEGVDVSAPDEGYYTVTNTDGNFTLKSDKKISRMTFSFPGYVSSTAYPKEKKLHVKLSPVNNLLDEALVISGDPRKIMDEAISRIEDNYPSSAEQFDCFYRETVKKRQRYIDISEAVTVMKKTSYMLRDVHKDAVAVKVGRRLISPKASDTLSVKVVGGPVQGALLDIVKSADMLLNPNELNRYQLTMLPPKEIDGRMNFVIGLTPWINDTPYPLYYGKVYIDRENLSFSRFELSLDMSDKSKATRAMLVKKPLGLRFNPKDLSITISYVTDPEDGKMRIRYVRTSFEFRCDWKKKLFATNFTAVNEMVVTHKQAPGTPFSRKQSFPDYASLSDRIGRLENPDFWKDYNIIEPSESLEKAIGKLKKAE